MRGAGLGTDSQVPAGVEPGKVRATWGDTGTVLMTPGPPTRPTHQAWPPRAPYCGQHAARVPAGSWALHVLKNEATQEARVGAWPPLPRSDL